MIRNTATLARWSSFRPGTRMPESLEDLALSDRMELGDVDPDLFALLAGTASAELEGAALSGKLNPAPPTAEARRAADVQAQVEELLADGNPFAVESLNVTRQFALAQLDPKKAAELQQAATPPSAPTGLSAEDVEYVRRQMATQRGAW